MKPLRAQRIGAGYYDVPTPDGTYRVEKMTAPRGSGGTSGWFVFSPGETMATASHPTKREAMAYLHGLFLGDPDYTSGSPAPKQTPEPSLDDYAKASRIIQSLIPGVRR